MIVAENASRGKRSSRQRHTYLVPKGFNPDDVPEHIRPQCVAFLHLLLSYWLSWRAEAGGWVRLKMAYLRQNFGRPGRRGERRWMIDDVLEYLVSEGWVEMGDYQKGVVSRAYRIPPDLLDFNTATIREEQLAVRSDSLARHTNLVHLHLDSQLDRLTIDLEAAEQVCLALVPGDGDDLDGRSLAEYRAIAWAQARVISLGIFELVGDAYGRVHSVFSRLHRALRPCLRLDGQPLVGIDLGCSQPLWMALVVLACGFGHLEEFARQEFADDLDPYRHDLLGLIAEAVRRCATCGGLPVKYHGVTSLVVGGTGNGGGDAGGRESVLLGEGSSAARPNCPTGGTVATIAPVGWRETDECWRGTVEFLRACLAGEAYTLLQPLSKSRAKLQYFEMLFGYAWRGSRLYRVLERHHPYVLEVLSTLKRHNPLKRRKHSHVAHILQAVESTTFIDTVARRLMERYQYIPLLTLHDGLYTTPRHLHIIDRVAREVFAELGLHHINLKTEIFRETKTTPDGAGTDGHHRPAGAGRCSARDWRTDRAESVSHLAQNEATAV